MAGRPSSAQCISWSNWDSIQEAAKADAKQAIATGDSSKLTALGKGYFHKFTKEQCKSSTR
tara:strand:- start:2090 stop:2272 length:183 start_codon:yes stop_codon:yes gene_type:complete